MAPQSVMSSSFWNQSNCLPTTNSSPSPQRPPTRPTSTASSALCSTTLTICPPWAESALPSTPTTSPNESNSSEETVQSRLKCLGSGPVLRYIDCNSGGNSDGSVPGTTHGSCGRRNDGHDPVLRRDLRCIHGLSLLADLHESGPCRSSLSANHSLADWTYCGLLHP